MPDQDEVVQVEFFRQLVGEQCAGLPLAGYERQRVWRTAVERRRRIRLRGRIP